MVVNPTNTGTGTGTDKYDPKGPFNIGQDYINQTQPFRTYNTNNTNTFNEDPCGNTSSNESGRSLADCFDGKNTNRCGIG